MNFTWIRIFSDMLSIWYNKLQYISVFYLLISKHICKDKLEIRKKTSILISCCCFRWDFRNDEKRDISKSSFRWEWGCSIHGCVGCWERLRAENDRIMLMTLVTPASLNVRPDSFVGLHPDSSNPTWACDPHRSTERSPSVLLWISAQWLLPPPPTPAVVSVVAQTLVWNVTCSLMCLHPKCV